MTRCPCGTGMPYDGCCGRFHRLESSPPTAEALMRSRYSAFAVADMDHLLRTWHPSTRPSSLVLDGDRTWIRLEVVSATGGGLFDSVGTVSFRAHSQVGDWPRVQSEISSFVRVDGEWCYVGPAPPDPVVPRR